MKNIAFFGLAIISLILVGCNNFENKSHECELTVTGCFADAQNTKVAISYDKNDYWKPLKQSWEVGDHVIGSYISKGNVVDIDYCVKAVTGLGYAVFEKVGDFPDPTEGTTVFALCLGEKGTGETYLKSKQGVVNGNPTDNYKTYMVAANQVIAGTLNFVFENKASVIGATEVRVSSPGSFYDGPLTLEVAMSGSMPSDFSFVDGGLDIVTTPGVNTVQTFNINPNEYYDAYTGFYMTVLPEMSNVWIDLTLAAPADATSWDKIEKSSTRSIGMTTNYDVNTFFNLGALTFEVPDDSYLPW